MFLLVISIYFINGIFCKLNQRFSYFHCFLNASKYTFPLIRNPLDNKFSVARYTLFWWIISILKEIISLQYIFNICHLVYCIKLVPYEKTMTYKSNVNENNNTYNQSGEIKETRKFLTTNVYFRLDLHTLFTLVKNTLFGSYNSTKLLDHNFRRLSAKVF